MKIKIIDSDSKKTKLYQKWTIKLVVCFILSIIFGLVFGFNWVA
mgnify:CR=1 FL=1